MAERQKALVRELELAAVGDADLGRALGVEIAVIGGEDMRRQVLDLAAALGATDGDAEAGPGIGVSQARAHHVGRVHPAIMLVLHGALRVAFLARRLLIGEPLHRNGRGTIRQARDDARHHE